MSPCHYGATRRLAEVYRRDLLKVGSLGLLGLSLPDILRSAAAQGLRPGAVKSCVLFFLCMYLRKT